ncbi:MAG: LysM peptidoglycan-binding domain-containing protein [Chloroflexi bacterium]|nr:LysM peptidoglycan-binding domain-containing protein [Chloroflexota bacterium]
MKRTILVFLALALLFSTFAIGSVAAQDGGTTYTVQAGDSLYRIAAKFNTTVSAIQSANGLTGSAIRIGQVLKIPASAPATPTVPNTPADPSTLILATTTSTADSGLLAAILPYFEARENIKIKVIAVGTGQALAIGAKGDADVVLVHARSQEDKFVADGNGIDRRDVMYNDFVIVGPLNDPAGIGGLSSAKDAFAKIAAAGSPFASRGDNSGTNTKETSLWTAAGLKPKSGANGYVALGQGMGETLLYSNETGSYTLADRGTWLALSAKLPNLTLLVGGASVKKNPDPALFNPYGVIAVNPVKFPKVNYPKAKLFIEWITSLSIQRRIYEFGRSLYGESLFYPVAKTP